MTARTDANQAEIVKPKRHEFIVWLNEHDCYECPHGFSYGKCPNLDCEENNEYKRLKKDAKP